MVLFNSLSNEGGKNRQFFIIAHNIRSLYNVGSIFRTADAFGVYQIFLTGYTPNPSATGHLNKIGKVALGAEYFVPWKHASSAVRVISRLRSDYPHIRIIGLENNTHAAPLFKFKPQFPLALVLGEEVKGINKKLLSLCDQVIEIPMVGKKESLNVSVAFGIAAYSVTVPITR